MDIWAFYSAVSKFGLYLGALVSAGLVFNAALFRAHIEWGSVKRLVLIFAILGALSAAANFSLRGAALMGEWSGATDPEILSILWETPVGTALVLRLIGFLLILASVVVGRVGMWSAVLGGVIALWSFTQIGHVADKSQMALQVVLLLHLCIAAFWLGVLTPLRRFATDPSSVTKSAALGHAFGSAAMIGVPILILAGAGLTYQLVGGLSGLVTPYGLVLLAKIAFVSMLLALGAANKLRFVPKLQGGESSAANHLFHSLTLEWVAFVCVLAITAVLTSTVSIPS